MVASSAEVGARPVVRGTRQAEGPLAEDDNRRVGAKAADRALEICHPRRRYRGRCDEGRLTAHTNRIL